MKNENSCSLNDFKKIHKIQKNNDKIIKNFSQPTENEYDVQKKPILKGDIKYKQNESSGNVCFKKIPLFKENKHNSSLNDFRS